MQRLGRRDVARFNQFVRQVYGVSDPADFARSALRLLRALIGVDCASYNVVSAKTGTTQWTIDPVNATNFPESAEVFARHIAEHPLVMHYAHSKDGSALKISDFLSTAEFHRLGLYQDFYRRRGVGYQMAVRLPSNPADVIGIALDRCKSDFAERDRTLLNLLRPHLSRALECAIAARTARENAAFALRGIWQLGFHMLVLRGSGNAEWSSPGAHEVIESYFDSPSEMRALVSSYLKEREHDLRSDEDIAAPIRPFIVCNGRGELYIYVLPGDRCTIILKEYRDEDNEARFLRLGLTKREAAVLRLVSRGLVNERIALELNISVRTVRKHLENIYVKLGVNSRSEAVAIALKSRAAQAPS